MKTYTRADLIAELEAIADDALRAVDRVDAARKTGHDVTGRTALDRVGKRADDVARLARAQSITPPVTVHADPDAAREAVA